MLGNVLKLANHTAEQHRCHGLFVWYQSQERLQPWLSSHSLTPLALLQLKPLSQRQLSLAIV